MGGLTCGGVAHTLEPQFCKNATVTAAHRFVWSIVVFEVDSRFPFHDGFHIGAQAPWRRRRRAERAIGAICADGTLGELGARPAIIALAVLSVGAGVDTWRRRCGWLRAGGRHRRLAGGIGGGSDDALPLGGVEVRVRHVV